jgi:chemotaxis protein CheD
MATDVEIFNPTRIAVSLADLVVTKDPQAMLCTLPLGVGIGIAIYDPQARVGGVLHSILPSSSLDPEWAADRPGMFLDTGLQLLLSRAAELHAKTENLQVVAAGAAQIIDESPAYNIGKSNFDTLGGLLSQLGVQIHAHEVGGKTNCSLELVVSTGEVRLRYCGQPKHKTLCKP